MSRNVLADQTQEQGVEAVRACAGRDDDDQHEGVKRFRQIEPIVDTIRSVDPSEALIRCRPDVAMETRMMTSRPSAASGASSRARTPPPALNRPEAPTID